MAESENNIMGKELRVHMDFYLEMKDGETEEQAKQRFYNLMETLKNTEDQESSYSEYETEIQDM